RWSKEGAFDTGTVSERALQRIAAGMPSISRRAYERRCARTPEDQQGGCPTARAPFLRHVDLICGRKRASWKAGEVLEYWIGNGLSQPVFGFAGPHLLPVIQLVILIRDGSVIPRQDGPSATNGVCQVDLVAASCQSDVGWD